MSKRVLTRLLLYFYFVGIAAKVAFKNSQNLFTDSMFTFSSGEWGELMVGPKDIMSQWG